MEEEQLLSELKEIKNQLQELMKSMTLLLSLAFNDEEDGEEEEGEDSLPKPATPKPLHIEKSQFKVVRSYIC